VGGQNFPFFLALAEDEGFACFALSIERVERLLQPFFGGLSRVDRAALDGLLVGSHWIFFAIRVSDFFLVPKKSGPDQRVPVIRRAISERL
jgi:hypothetical protein